MLQFLGRRFLFRPSRYPEGWQEPEGIAVHDVWLTLPAGRRLHGWWCPVPADRERWVLLYCHGNSGHLGQRGDRVRTWQHQLGPSVLIFDYPGDGRSEGRPTEAGCYAATHAAHRWLLAQRKASPEKLLVLGKSLGGAATSASSLSLGVATPSANRSAASTALRLASSVSRCSTRKPCLRWATGERTSLARSCGVAVLTRNAGGA
jgi:pimeloyl-ACP methyl ester carboxylesterase